MIKYEWDTGESITIWRWVIESFLYLALSSGEAKFNVNLDSRDSGRCSKETTIKSCHDMSFSKLTPDTA